MEPRKKKPSYFPLYWLVNRDPYNGLLQSLYNWVGWHPLYNRTNHGFFSLLNGVLPLLMTATRIPLVIVWLTSSKFSSPCSTEYSSSDARLENTTLVTPTNKTFVGGWTTNPVEKYAQVKLEIFQILVKLDHFSPNRSEKLSIFETHQPENLARHLRWLPRRLFSKKNLYQQQEHVVSFFVTSVYFLNVFKLLLFFGVLQKFVENMFFKDSFFH